MHKLLGHIKTKIEQDRVECAMSTGTTIYSYEQFAKRVGVCEGLQRAIDIITETSKSLDEEEYDDF